MTATNLHDPTPGAAPTQTRIGRYRLLGLLATGGMAQVYLALSGELSGFRTLVVVKRILPHLSSNRQFIDMFFDEARIAARLDHPNIVRIIEVGQDNDEYFLAMEVVQGRPLAALLRRTAKHTKPLGHSQAAYLVAQAANGLAHAHNLLDTDGRPLNIVHRDVSPQNILVSLEGAVKVIDFGVARALGRVTETVPGGLKGKIQYMAPEQVSAGKMDRRSDVFALGIVLWEALCGRKLFQRDSELETLRAIVEEQVPSPSSLVRIAPVLERIVMRALEKDPAGRFQSAAEMALALERYAFANEDFSPLQLAMRMKALFPSDHARWRATVAATMNLEGPPETWKNTSGSYVRPQAIDLQTRGPTVSLRRGLPPGRPVAARGGDGVIDGDVDGDSDSTPPSDVKELLMPVPPPIPPPPVVPLLTRRRARINRGVALGAGVMLALLTATALSAVSHWWDRALSTRAAGAPQPSIVSSPSPSPLPSIAMVSPMPPSVSIAPTGESRTLPSIEVWPLPSSAEVAVQAPSAPPVHPAAFPAAPKASMVATGSTELPKHRSTHRRGGSRRSSRDQASQVDDARDDARGTPNPTPTADTVDAFAPTVSPASTMLADDGDECAVMLGSQPWSEIWIDGKSTGKHTPYSEPIACGVHKLSFVRQELGLKKTVTITVRPGERFKKAIHLKEE